MNWEQKLFGICLLAMMCTGLMFVTFGQVTVRKLRRNPETKGYLGVEFASGWDILNVAQALSLPRSWSKVLDRSPLSGLYANSELLYRNTTKFDRCLARIFYWMYMGAEFR
jgi:hypothetical protein